MHAPVSRQHRVVDLWTWIPAFRAVAELQHVQRAAQKIHVTASSLSRAIRLLEEQLGKKLFDRVGRNVRLNHDGEEFLTAVREGMRRIDDGIARVTGTVFTGELRVACEGDQPIAFAWRAAARLMQKEAGVRTTVEQAPARSELAARLLRGDLDVAIVTSPPANAQLLVEHLGELTYGIYCGMGHPLYRQRRPTLETICAHPFVGPTATPDGASGDQWPEALERTVTLRLPALQPAVAVCASGAFLAVLPDIAASESAEHALLRRLPSDAVPSSPLFAVRRRPTGGHDRIDELVAAFRAHVQEKLRVPARAGARGARPGASARTKRRSARRT
jgi:DNA-binding transcriptional LysR family regulator